MKQATFLSESHLVLSLFPGLGLLDRQFELAGFCVVRGPDLIWGGDIRCFHPSPGKFDGVIGGPPCQAHSSMAGLVRAFGRQPRFGNLVPEFERCVEGAQPVWFIMENVPRAPLPHPEGYKIAAYLIRDYHVGGIQPRQRRFTFGTRDGRPLDIEWTALPPAPILPRSVTRNYSPTQRAANRKNALPNAALRPQIPGLLEAQGLPQDFFKFSPFTSDGKREALINGVPAAMGRAIARAVLKAVCQESP